MSSELTLEYLSHCITRRSINRLDFVFCVSVDTDFSNHGQTPRSVVGTETQTSCNFKANPRDESCSQQMVLYDSYITVSSKHGLLLNVQYSSHPPSSKSSTRPCSTKEPKKSTEHSVIQKGSVHCNMTAIDASRWLSTLWCSCGCVV